MCDKMKLLTLSKSQAGLTLFDMDILVEYLTHYLFVFMYVPFYYIHSCQLKTNNNNDKMIMNFIG